MGVAVSSWKLAKAVAQTGQMGVVSGTGIDTVMVRRLQRGDLDGSLRRAFDNFPIREVAERAWKRYFVEGGIAPNTPFKAKPTPSIKPPQALVELLVLANFCEVFLAKEGHDGMVGINLLEKIQLPTLPSLYGAMLAKVDVVLVGAGIPRNIPPALDALAEGREAVLPIDVQGAQGTVIETKFDPNTFVGGTLPRPKFFAIIASTALALTLVKRGGGVDGFVIEGDSAGGHNAPPRGAMQLDEAGEPIYGPRDTPELAPIRELGLPFWLAGSYGQPGKLQDAIELGAQGVQVGTAFAFCEESGIDPDIKRQVLEMSQQGKAKAVTAPFASPTGFPFKIVPVAGTLSESKVDKARPRICDLGYLRTAYMTEKGEIGYRCPAEPVDDFIKKGGTAEDCEGRVCLCNGLLATVGLGQFRKEVGKEPPIVTAGRDVATVAKFIPAGQTSYKAADVVKAILTPTAS